MTKEGAGGEEGRVGATGHARASLGLSAEFGGWTVMSGGGLGSSPKGPGNPDGPGVGLFEKDDTPW